MSEWTHDIGCLILPSSSIQKAKQSLLRRGWVPPKGVPYLYPHPSRTAHAVIAVTHPEALDAVRIGSWSCLEAGTYEWCQGMRLEDTVRPPKHRAATPSPQGPSRFTHVELFAGIGGFSAGLAPLGGRCVFASEIDQTKVPVFYKNFPGSEGFLWGNISHVYASSIPDHDILTAGFPCEPFSHANFTRQGFDDNRGQIFWQIVRVLEMKQPPCFLLENVPGLLTFEDGTALKVIKGALERAGYHVQYQVLNAVHFVPQKRKRLYIIGTRRDLDRAGANSSFVFPVVPEGQKSVPRTSGEVLEVLSEDKASHYTLSDTQWKHVVETWQSDKGEAARPIGKKLMRLEGWASTLTKNYKRSYRMYTEFVHQGGGRNPRFLTPRECMRLMGFDDTFALAEAEGDAYAHAGSAVCPPVITFLGKALVEWLENVVSHEKGFEERKGEMLP